MYFVGGAGRKGVSGPVGSGSPSVSAGETNDCAEGMGGKKTAADPPHQKRVGDQLAKAWFEPSAVYAVMYVMVMMARANDHN